MHQEQQEEEDETNVSRIWQRMVQLTEDIVSHGKIFDYFAEMLQIFVNDSVDLNHELTFTGRKVSNLESKLSSIHAIDFKAQNDSQTLRKELLELKQQRAEEEKRYQEEVAALQQTLLDKSNAERELTNEVNTLKGRYNQTLSDNKSAVFATRNSTKQMEKQLNSATAEKRRFEEVLSKVQDTVLAG